MRFKQFLKYTNVNFDFINKSMFENMRSDARLSKSKKGINENLLKSNEQLINEGFYKKFPHLE